MNIDWSKLITKKMKEDAEANRIAAEAMAKEKEIETAAIQKLEELVSIANSIIQPLQDDYDVGDITDEDREVWLVWKRYRSALMKTPNRTGWYNSPDWPTQPEIT